MDYTELIPIPVRDCETPTEGFFTRRKGARGVHRMLSKGTIPIVFISKSK